MSCIKGSNPFVSAIQQKRPLRGVFYFRLSLIQDLEGHSPPSAYRKKGISLLRDLDLRSLSARCAFFRLFSVGYGCTGFFERLDGLEHLGHVVFDLDAAPFFTQHAIRADEESAA